LGLLQVAAEQRNPSSKLAAHTTNTKRSATNGREYVA